MVSFETESCVQGFHIYKNWTPVISQELKCAKEEDNPCNCYAVAIIKTPAILPAGDIVGHVPRCILAMCSSFIRRGGEIFCTIIGSRRYSRDLP